MKDMRAMFDAKFNALEERVKALLEENESLRAQLLQSTQTEGPSCSAAAGKQLANANTPPRKVAKRTSSKQPEDVVMSEDDFPSIPSTSCANKVRNRVNINLPINQNNPNVKKGSSTRSTNPARVFNSDHQPPLTTNQDRKKVLQAIDTNIFYVRQQIAKSNCSSYSVKQSSVKGPVKVVISDEKEVSIIKSVLTKAKISYHEYKWADEKQKCFIVRGLVGATEADLPDLKEELVQLGLPSDISLAMHHTGFMRANPKQQHNVPVKIIVPPNFDDKALQQIKYINHIAVRFELFKSKAVVQCKNCQRFGHSAGGCQHEHRCVKCGQNHFRDNCPRTSNAHYKLKCCNCGGEHTANNLNSCPYFQRNFGSKQQLQQQQQQNQQATARAPVPVLPGLIKPAPVRSGVSFAEVVGTPSTRRTQTLTNPNISNTRDNGSNREYFEHCFSKCLEAIGELTKKSDSLNQIILKHDRILDLLAPNLAHA